MGNVDSELIPVSTFTDAELSAFLKRHGISLTLEETRKSVTLIDRDPTLTELHIFNIQWSEHSSYKSSREVLKLLPTKAPNVILGPSEDSGIFELATINGEKYGIVVSHESHNHPSQVVPYEGAATGVGGIIRDVLCMGAKVIATADPLRFGNPHGKNKERTRYIANEVIRGIAGYGNPLGIPNIAGDVSVHDSFDDNCLVNVVCLGIIKEKDIIHSAAPKHAVGYDIIVVGKATDNSGFGGASFASVILDEKDKESNKGAVQVPDPFLKNVLLRATYAVFEEARKQKIELGFKDMGAGGIMCATSELCDAAHVGCEIDLDSINVSMDIPDFMIACSETQERFAFISPKKFTKTILKIYNEDFELPNVAEQARAVVVGTVTKGTDYVLKHKGNTVCNAPVDVITSGITYERPKKAAKRTLTEPSLKEPHYHDVLLKVLNHPAVASKASVYNRYDTSVLGLTTIKPGQADAGVMAPLPGEKVGVALSVDHNPLQSAISPYHAAVNAVAEAMRNVAAVGAIPAALTDCLCFGNPEQEEVFHDFYQAVNGIADAANNLHYKGTTNPVPIVSGNVSFYNQSATGKAVLPSPIISCSGVLKDYSKAITMKLKKKDSLLFLIGERKDELGASIYYQLHDEIGKNIPTIDFEAERSRIYAVLDMIDQRLLLSCHDISDGGLATTVSEMILGGEADGQIGADIDLSFSDLRSDKILFSETSGFVIEVEKENEEKVKKIGKKYAVPLIPLGTTKGDSLTIKKNNKNIVTVKINQLKEAWTTGFPQAME